MRKRVFLLLLQTVVCFARMDQNNARVNRSNVGNIPTRGTQSLATSQYSIPISPTQVNNKGYFDINVPGYYFLTENFGFYPTGYTAGDAITNNASIYISADNTVLDLNSKTISHKSTRAGHPNITTEGIAGIRVADNVKNLTIKNGKINFVTGNGILVGQGCSNITLSELSIMNCPDSGIKCIGAEGTDNMIKNLVITDSSVTECSGTIILVAGETPTLGGTGNALGIELDYVVSGQITSTSSSNNIVVKQDAHPATISQTFDNRDFGIGLKISNSNLITISNCNFNYNKGPFAAGVYAEKTHNLTVINSDANENQAYGLHSENASSLLWVSGFHLKACSYANFTDVRACHNNTTGTESIGFWLDGSSDDGRCSFNSFKNCVATSNIAGEVLDTLPVLTPIGAGFYSIGQDVDNQNKNNSFIGCTAKGSESDKVSAAGIHLEFENGPHIEGCVCSFNGTTDSDKVETVKGYGIYLGPETGNNTVNAIIRNNWLIANTWYGIKDDSDDCRSLIMENYAFRNGYLNDSYSQGNLSINALNYSVNYEESGEMLPLTSATIGGFGALNVATRFSNTEIQVAADSLVPGQTGYPSAPE